MGIAGATVAAGVVAAGASVAGGALSQPTNPTARVSSPGSAVDPSMQASQFFNLLNYGIVDSASLVQAGPINRMIAAMQANGTRAIDSRGDIIDQINDMWNGYNKWVAEHPGEFVPNKVFSVQGTKGSSGNKIAQHFSFGNTGQGDGGRSGNNLVQEEALQSLGYPSVRELFEAQINYNAQIKPILARAGGLAASGLNTRFGTQESINNMLANLPDASGPGINALSEKFKTSYLRDLGLNVGRQQQDLLAAANAGNFNPGTALGDLNVYKAGKTQDADLEAMQRALALIGGQQGLAGNSLNIMQGALGNIDTQANALATINLGSSPAGVNYKPVTVNPIGAALSDAGVSIGNSIGNAALLSKLSPGSSSSSSSPAYTGLLARNQPQYDWNM